MLIGANYQLEGDNLNITLSKRLVSKRTGEPYWSAIAWFMTLKGALTYLVDLEVSETKLTDLKTVVEKQDELYNLIGTAITIIAVAPAKGAGKSLSMGGALLSPSQGGILVQGVRV
jgi:hypothetical protein